MISQLQRTPVTGADFHTLLQRMTAGAGSLNGAELHQFWMTALGGTGRSEVLVGCIQRLLGGAVTATQVKDCILPFLDRRHRIELTKDELLTR